ncbi:MAG: AAA family ATPase [Haliscomenobacter sp.]|nr:AAA family ATPase [Haliscomenobacter sp.]
MIPRILGATIRQAAQKMPVVAVTGPRQSGKSTLVRQIFPDHAYSNLEDMEQRSFCQTRPQRFSQKPWRLWYHR